MINIMWYNALINPTITFYYSSINHCHSYTVCVAVMSGCMIVVYMHNTSCHIPHTATYKVIPNLLP